MSSRLDLRCSTMSRVASPVTLQKTEIELCDGIDSAYKEWYGTSEENDPANGVISKRFQQSRHQVLNQHVLQKHILSQMAPLRREFMLRLNQRCSDMAPFSPATYSNTYILLCTFSRTEQYFWRASKLSKSL